MQASVCGLWGGRDVYRDIPGVTRSLGFRTCSTRRLKGGIHTGVTVVITQYITFYIYICSLITSFEKRTKRLVDSWIVSNILGVFPIVYERWRHVDMSFDLSGLELSPTNIGFIEYDDRLIFQWNIRDCKYWYNYIYGGHQIIVW